MSHLTSRFFCCFLLLFCCSLLTRAQSPKWVAVFEKGEAEQAFQRADDWPISWIKEKWDQGFFLTDVTYSDFKWVVVMTQNQAISQQSFSKSNRFPSAFVRSSWAKGYHLQSVQYMAGQWLVIMDLGTASVSDALVTVPTEAQVKSFAQAQWAAGKYLSGVAHGDGLWAVSAAKDSTLIDQSFQISAQFPEDFIQQYWAQEYSIGHIGYGNHRWIVIMNKTKAPFLSYLQAKSFPEALVKEKWAAGERIASLAASVDLERDFARNRDLGQDHFASKNYNLARFFFQRALALKPSDPALRGMIAQTRELDGTSLEALKKSLSPSALDSYQTAGTQTSPGRSYALLIGVEDYEQKLLSNLSHPLEGAKRLGQVLVDQYGFLASDVELLANPSQAEIFESLAKYRIRLQAGDRFLLFFSGHSDFQGPMGGWLPRDAEVMDGDKWISHADVSDLLKDMQAAHTLLISDAGFAVPLGKAGFQTSEETGCKALAQWPSCQALVGAPSRAEPVKGIFVNALIQALESAASDCLSAEELFQLLKASLSEKGEALPEFGSLSRPEKGEGSFLFQR